MLSVREIPLINSRISDNVILIVLLRSITGLIWFGTVLRRILLPNFGNFEVRITEMSQGILLLPDMLMQIAVANWFLVFLFLIIIEFLASVSLLTGTLARGGAFLATFIGFGIGMAGIGISLIDLVIPWSAAFVSLFLLLFTHPGIYFGVDSKLKDKNLPDLLKKLI